MEAGYKIESNLWGRLRGNYIHVFNFHWINKIAMHERTNIDKDKDCIGVWKLKTKK